MAVDKPKNILPKRLRLARQVAINYVSALYPDLTLDEIGQIFRIDKTSVSRTLEKGRN